MPSSSTPPVSTSSSSPKKGIVFTFENVLIPGKYIPHVDVENAKKIMKGVLKYCSQKGIKTYLISAYSEEVCEKKLREYGFDSFFPKENIRAVHPAYLSQMEEIDRTRYHTKCAEDAECTDEYFRQVEMQSILKKEGWSAQQMVLIGHDYWFDGFYTRRYSGVDVAFLETQLTSRGKPLVERVSGLWHIPFTVSAIKKILEGKTPAPNYGPLDAWVSVTLTEELLGSKGFNMVKRVILERKKSPSTPTPPSGDDSPPMVQ